MGDLSRVVAPRAARRGPAAGLATGLAALSLGSVLALGSVPARADTPTPTPTPTQSGFVIGTAAPGSSSSVPSTPTSVQVSTRPAPSGGRRFGDYLRYYRYAVVAAAVLLLLGILGLVLTGDRRRRRRLNRHRA